MTIRKTWRIRAVYAQGAVPTVSVNGYASTKALKL